MSNLNAKAFGLAFGVLWGASMLLLTVIAMYTGYGVEWVDLMASVYIGVAATWQGAVLSLLWGFVDGFVGGFLLAWLYNKFS